MVVGDQDRSGAKLREGTTTILPREGERSRESACLQGAFTPLAALLHIWLLSQNSGSCFKTYRSHTKLWTQVRMFGIFVLALGLQLKNRDSWTTLVETFLNLTWGVTT